MGNGDSKVRVSLSKRISRLSTAELLVEDLRCRSRSSLWCACKLAGLTIFDKSTSTKLKVALKGTNSRYLNLARDSCKTSHQLTVVGNEENVSLHVEKIAS